MLLLDISAHDADSIQQCLDWPWVGSGRRTRTLSCEGDSIRVQAISQLPPLTEQSAPEVLSLQAERVEKILEALTCESVRSWKPSKSAR